MDLCSMYSNSGSFLHDDLINLCATFLCENDAESLI